jgi:hypothetical protein
VQCSAVQCSAVQCSAVQCSAVQCRAVQCSAVQCLVAPTSPPQPPPPPARAGKPPSHATHQPGGPADEGTVRRKAKRRGTNCGVPGEEEARRRAQHHGCNNVSGRRSKSRSKSRSPGREIERAIVIVHHTTCNHSRTASPDNLSESSISFHENEVAFDLSPPGGGRGPGQGAAGGWYHGAMEPCVSVAREPGPSADVTASCRTLAATALQYSNWESCRESWFSSGSEPRPSSGSDCPPRPPSFGEVAEPPVGKSAPGTPRLGGRAGREGSGEKRCASAASAATLPRSAVRQASRESSGSSRGARATPTRPPAR